LSSEANAEVSYLIQVQIEDVAKCNNLLMRKKYEINFHQLQLSKICRKNVHM